MNIEQATQLVDEFAVLEASLVAQLEGADADRRAVIEGTLTWARGVQRAIADGDEEAKSVLMAQASEVLAALGIH